ncbi:DNA topoisomerase 3-alpha [Chlorella sorokiniana]|uniref:DNA topoisomerase 3-alpha n=1 Tax=Chlorella sorokiniana TaxID=3076 RepID=A0A2P6TW93_CHLSO|nr:DNA topoisomerase 3-alpha [Chlorella sorokiniana]|eukprot:PRW58331.1 DNA topoisomerase 3-alpha [Chlorella sorokiniana]
MPARTRRAFAALMVTVFAMQLELLGLDPSFYLTVLPVAEEPAEEGASSSEPEGASSSKAKKGASSSKSKKGASSSNEPASTPAGAKKCPKCACGLPATRRTVSKPNRTRPIDTPFFNCPKSLINPANKCEFFAWEDEWLAAANTNSEDEELAELLQQLTACLNALKAALRRRQG